MSKVSPFLCATVVSLLLVSVRSQTDLSGFDLNSILENAAVDPAVTGTTPTNNGNAGWGSAIGWSSANGSPLQNVAVSPYTNLLGTMGSYYIDSLPHMVDLATGIGNQVGWMALNMLARSAVRSATSYVLDQSPSLGFGSVGGISALSNAGRPSSSSRRYGGSYPTHRSGSSRSRSSSASRGSQQSRGYKMINGVPYRIM